MVFTTQPTVKEEAQVQIKIDTKLKIESDTGSLPQILQEFSQVL